MRLLRVVLLFFLVLLIIYCYWKSNSLIEFFENKPDQTTVDLTFPVIIDDKTGQLTTEDGIYWIDFNSDQLFTKTNIYKSYSPSPIKQTIDNLELSYSNNEELLFKYTPSTFEIVPCASRDLIYYDQNKNLDSNSITKLDTYMEESRKYCKDDPNTKKTEIDVFNQTGAYNSKIGDNSIVLKPYGSGSIQLYISNKLRNEPSKYISKGTYEATPPTYWFRSLRQDITIGKHNFPKLETITFYRGLGLISKNAKYNILGLSAQKDNNVFCLLYTSPSPRDVEESRMPSSA